MPSLGASLKWEFIFGFTSDELPGARPARPYSGLIGWRGSPGDHRGVYDVDDEYRQMIHAEELHAAEGPQHVAQTRRAHCLFTTAWLSQRR